ncbi:MAG TPA: alpha/beta fold hydrolase [Acidimicrobiales bacterium]|nr:alpha/beta fold hydrolase [Acidimicrobiales bacterium]
MKAARWSAVAVGLGAAATAGYALQRVATRRWRVGEGELAAAERTLPADLRHHFVTVDDGGRIHAVERGDGPPVVLVHGITLGVATWAPQLRQLADRHRVIAVGQRGHGQSLAGEDGYSLERLADDLLAVLDALDVTGGLLVGHSMGGMVAQLLAVRHPDDLARHVAGLVLVATTDRPMAVGPVGPVGPLVAAGLAAGASRGLGRAERRGQGLFPSDDLALWATRASFGAHPAPADVELTRAMIAAMSPSAVSGLLGPLLAFDVHRQIHAIDLPTHVVVGTRDVLTPPRMARAIVGQIPGATLHVLPGCGHMVMLERADQLCDLLHRALPHGDRPAA